MRTIDLRSDCVTLPSQAMKEAMMAAPLGDDVLGDDPTVNALQERVAQMLGKEASLFVVSGTMANQLAIGAQTSPHDEVILDLKSHIFQFEQGAPAVLSGVQLRPVDFGGVLPQTEMIASHVRTPDIHHPSSRMLCLEATHNYRGGTIPDFTKMKEISNAAHRHGLKVHIDGARIWNAAVASSTKITEFAEICDSMMFCFSKGLGCPIGSVLAGSKEMIKKAHYLRKGFGGGWRQAGMLAAAANYALDNNIDRLADDHRRAKLLAEAIEANPELELIGRVETNIIYFRPRIASMEQLSAKLTANGILHDWRHFNAFRFVVHMDITDEMVEKCVKTIINNS